MKTNFEEQYISVNNITLHVVTAGPENGEPVILLHGFPEFWMGWKKQLDALTEQGYMVIVPDQRGHNLSQVPRQVSDYSLNELTADVIGLINHFGYEQVNLIGHDWGAAVAWNTASYFPGRIKKLGILNVPHPKIMLKFLSKSFSQMLKSWYIGFFQIPWIPDFLFTINDFYLAIQLLKKSGKSTTFTDDDMLQYRIAYKNAKGLTGMINWYRAILRYPPPETETKILNMPVLILWGRKDVALSAEMAKESLGMCSQAELIYIDDATHWVQHDAYLEVNQHLCSFLAK